MIRILASSPDPGLWGPTLVAALVAAGVSLLTLAVTHKRARKDRQREVFASAYAAACAYREFPFIVRRRDETGADRQQISRDLSTVQAALNEYRARLTIEAPRVGRAYAHVVAETRRVAGAEIDRGWGTSPPGTDGPMSVRDIDLTPLHEPDAQFLLEVRDHLSFVPAWMRRSARKVCTTASRGWRKLRRNDTRNAN